jgi:foldase protein PrsA
VVHWTSFQKRTKFHIVGVVFKMKKWFIAVTTAACVLTLSACNNADKEVIAETSAGDITKDELYEAMKERFGKDVLRELVHEKVLSKKYKVSDEEIKKELENLKEMYGPQYEMAVQQNGEEAIKEMVKVDLLRQKAATNDIKVTEEEMKKYYDELKPEIRASHILVDDEKTAKEVKAKLDQGEDFEKLAKEYSKDPGSAEKGGDLGWFGPGKMVKQFEDAAYALKVGEISGPVKSDFGYHIIKLTDKKEKKPFEKMKDEIEFEIKKSKLDPGAVEKALQQEMKKADVKIKDEDLKGIFEEQKQ